MAGKIATIITIKGRINFGNTAVHGIEDIGLFFYLHSMLDTEDMYICQELHKVKS